MAGDADLARIGFLLSDRNRAAMLLLLLDGRPQPVSALMAEIGISASLASTHLRKLQDGGLVVVEVSGRQRLYRLASPVAEAIEGLLLLARPGPAKSLRQATRGRKLREARVRYDHLAGSLGAAVKSRLLELGWIDLLEASRAVDLTEAGRRELRGRLGVDPA
ncbi:winged helix-turn-helix domain-containing protein [Amycolatopsis sp. NPDC023774]|uniref:ArsR/SmtB family transcription factor n=1 Tax=Amycolatopsis sp. NPDC023774 TaxID=3155015 RepID=UPI0033FB0E55